MFYIDPNTKKTKLDDGRIEEKLYYKESRNLFGIRYFDKDNKLIGVGKFYDDKEGHLVCEVTYKNGKGYSRIEYTKDGKASEPIYYENEKK